MLATADSAADLELGEGGSFAAEAGGDSRARAADDSAPAPLAPPPPPLQPPPPECESTPPVCRICLGGAEESVGPCFALRELSCACRGELRLVHAQCATTWFTSRGSGVCEICNAKAWELPANAQRPAGAEETVACGWRDQRARHAVLSLLCSAVMSFVVFGAPAIAHSSLRQAP